MRKRIISIITVTFVLTAFLGLNLQHSVSFPGYGGNANCNTCHNQPVFAKNHQFSFRLGDWNAYTLFNQYGNDSTVNIPVVQANNRSNLEYIRMIFLKNSTHIMTMAEIPDNTQLNASSATSDKFGILFNIDVVNFTVGDFLTNYVTAGNIVGQMGFANGHADLWYVDTAITGFNTSGLAQDMYISSAIISDGVGNQNVQFAIYYGHLSQYSLGYRIYFVRLLDTGGNNDVQFNQDGMTVSYAIAVWDNSAKEYHFTSTDQMLVVGNQVGAGTITYNYTSVSTVVNTGTVTKSVTTTETTTNVITSLSSIQTGAYPSIFIALGILIGFAYIRRISRKD